MLVRTTTAEVVHNKMISKMALRYLISVVIATLIAGALISMDLKALGVNVIKTSESTQPPIGKVTLRNS